MTEPTNKTDVSSEELDDQQLDAVQGGKRKGTVILEDVKLTMEYEKSTGSKDTKLTSASSLSGTSK